MRQIGRYRVLGEIGRGAMGVVYRAEDPAIGRIVAIKTIRLAEAASDKERQFLRERLFREARSAGSLSHPGIVTIYDVYEEHGVCYVFMEYVDGPTLEQVLHGETAISNAFLVDVLEQTAAALDYAHAKGIVHRDIKPGNIMIASSGVVKITDFGVAKFTSQQATNTGMLLGTPSFMSPEQISDGKIDGRADQFSLAVITYLMLTGERPFEGSSLPALMFKIVHDEPDPVHRLNASLSPAVDVVIRKAMSKTAAERYGNCVQFIRALTTALGQRPGWAAMRPGRVESMETVADSAAVAAPAAAVPPVAATPQPPLTAPAPTAAPTRSSRRFDDTTIGWRYVPRWVYALSVLVFVGLLIAGRALLFHNDNGAPNPPPTPAQSQKMSGDENKPSAMGPMAQQPAPTPPPVEEGVKPDEPKVETKAPEEAKPAPTPVPTRAPGPDVGVRVVTNPPGAKVMFDGQSSLMCTTPCEFKLSEGRHTLITMLDGYRNAQQIIQVPQEREVVLALDRSFGTLSLRSTPAGAVIFIDGQERRERTPATLTLSTGKHKLAVVKEGQQKQEQEIVIREGVVTNLDITWSN